MFAKVWLNVTVKFKNSENVLKNSKILRMESFFKKKKKDEK